MKPLNFFSIGGATFDIFVKTSDQAIMTFSQPDDENKWLCLPHGGKVRVEHIIETFGGGATNTAVAFSRMGFQAHFVGKIGAMYGDKVIDNLKKEKVSTEFVKETKRDKTAFSNIINTFDGDRTVLAYAGANRFFSAKDLPLTDLAQADWIFLNHLTEKNSQIPKALSDILKKNPKIKLAWNPGYEQLNQGIKKWKFLLEKTEILFINKEEAELFTGLKAQPAGIKKDDPHYHLYRENHFLPPYADDVSQLMAAFVKMGVKYVVITDGRNGAQATDSKNLYFCPIITRKRIDTLGAGDAFASGFTGALALGKDLKTALIYGTMNANSVVDQYGAQAGLLTRKALESQSRAHSLKVNKTVLKV